MRRNRITYSVVLIAAITFSYFYPGNVSSMFFYTVLLIPIASLLYTFYIYQKFTYLQGVDKKFVTKGETVYFNIDIVNETKFLYPYVEIIFYGVDTIFTKHFKAKRIAVLPDATGRYSFELECQYRGYYEVGLKEIKIKDFLGIFSFKYQVLQPRYITVYPRIVVLDTFPIRTNKLSYVEGELNAKEEDQMTLSNIRQYVYGDSIKKIHWKLSAKKDEIMVKNFDSTVNKGITILLDLTKNPYTVVQNTILEDKVVEVTVAIVHYALTHDIEVEFIYHDDSMKKEKAEDYSYFESIYKTLFKIKFESEATFVDTVKLALLGDVSRNTLILITSNLDDKVYSQISMQYHLGYEVILIYISPETLVPAKEAQKAEQKAVLSALKEMNVKAYEIHINDDIKYILGC